MAGKVYSTYGRESKIVYTTHYKEAFANILHKKTLNLFDPEYTNVLFFGLSKYKGSDLILKSLLYMKDSGKFNKIKFVIVGKFDDLKKLRKIENVINSEGTYDIKKNIIMYNFFVEDNMMDYLYRNSDIIALPYKEISFSGVLAYSINYGKDIIAPYMGSFVELKNIYPSNIHLLYNMDEINFLEKILEIKNRTFKLNNISQNNYRYQIKDNYIDIYRSVLKK
jgi:hypothetical protein